MTTKTKAPMLREGVKKAKAPVREGLAFLIEDALERSEVVIAAESIIDKLQSMAEDLSTVEAKDIMPLLDSLTNAFGPQVAENFNNVATEQVRQLITAVQGAKTALDNEILRLKQAVEGGGTTDMAMDASAPMMPAAGPVDEPAPGAAPPGAPGAPGEGLPEVPTDASGNAEDDSLAVGGSFAGRDKKMESRLLNCRIRGKRRPSKHIAEDVMPQSHESHNLDPNLSNLHLFHGGAGKLADSIRNMIRSEELTGEQRQGLANVLSHLGAFAHEPAHWSGVDADKKLNMALQSANIWKVDSPALEKIVGQMKRLAHLLSLHHDRMLESNIAMLRKASDPDSVILKMFRTKLRENQDGQWAAIRTARAFAIDIEDVVAVVKEAAARRPFQEAKKDLSVPDSHRKKIALSTLKMNDVGANIMGGMTKDEARSFLKSIGYSDARIKKLEEDSPPLMQGVPMFPVEQGGAASTIVSNPMNAPAQPAPTNAQPAQTDLLQPPQAANQSASTNKPLSPGDMRARQAAQQHAEQQQAAVSTAVQNNTQAAQPQPQAQALPNNAPQFQPPGKVMKPNDPAVKRATQR